MSKLHPARRGAPENLGGSVRAWRASWKPTLFNSEQNIWFNLPYFTFDPKFDTLYLQTSIISASVWSVISVPGNDFRFRKHLRRASNYPMFMGKTCSFFKNHPPIPGQSAKHTLIQTKMVKFHTKMAKKRYLLAQRIPIYGLYKGVPIPPPP